MLIFRKKVKAIAYVSIPKDLSHIKTKILMGLTRRQLVCFGGGAALGLPLFFLSRAALGASSAALLMIFVMLPFLLLGLYEKHGQPLEKIVLQVLRVYFLRPKYRPYQTNNCYAALLRQHKLDKEVYAIVKAQSHTEKTGRSRHR